MTIINLHMIIKDIHCTYDRVIRKEQVLLSTLTLKSFSMRPCPKVALSETFRSMKFKPDFYITF